MKKKTLIPLLILSSSAYSASIEVGFENEKYTNKYKLSNVFMPYLATNFNPIDDSSLNVSIKYLHQDQYGKKYASSENDKFKTDRERIEVYIRGYTWKKGKFTFSPQAGFRYEARNINYDSQINKQEKRRVALRFSPNITYKINDQVSLYLNGFVAPVVIQVKQLSRKDDSEARGQSSKNNYYSNYHTEFQLLGVKYKINNENTIWSSIYNERQYVKHISKHNRWQWRVGYSLKTTNNLSINPFIRYDLYYKEENIENVKFSKNHGKSRNKDELRIGSTIDYQVTPTINILGGIHWQTVKVENYSGESADNKNRMFYKLGIRKTF